jgi:Domain of unknown function (DUF3846)
MPSPARFQTSNPGRVADKTKNYLIIVRPESRHIAIEEAKRPPSLARLQQIVGGNIESVPHFDVIWGRKCVAFCNEEGKLKKLIANLPAQHLWVAAYPKPGDILVGPIAILAGTPEFLRQV